MDTKEPIIERFHHFCTNPSKETYLSVFRLVAASEFYDPYSEELGEAIQLFRKTRDWAAALEHIQADMPNQILSPKAHRTLSTLYRRGLQRQKAEEEEAIAAVCLEGILSTGDGSPESPFLVMRVSDEYDVLRHLGRRSVKQAFLQREGRSYDSIQCEDGAVLWFDVSAPHQRMSEELELDDYTAC